MRCSRYASSSGRASGSPACRSPLAPPPSVALLQRADRRRQTRPATLTSTHLPSCLTRGLSKRSCAVDAVAAEPVAIRDPALVDRFVVARHDAPQLAAQHVREQVAARAVVRAHDGPSRPSPKRAL